MRQGAERNTKPTTMLTQQDIQVFKQAIENAGTVFLSAHVGPDGDTLGSMLGLKFALAENFKHLKRIDAVIAGKVPGVYEFLPGVHGVLDVETAADVLLPEYDLAFSVDCGAVERLGPARLYFEKAKQSINIDHHYSNARFGTVNIIDVEAGASGEVVADLLMGNDIPISKEAATALYVAILTDTGGFKFSSTSAKIFELVAHLTRRGADPNHIYRHVYDIMPKAQVILHAQGVERARFNASNSLCWTTVSQADLKAVGADDDHIEGLIDILRRIAPVKIAALIKETRAGLTKISLRSDVETLNVAEIAARWNGGGHKMAAGANIEKPPAAVEAELIPVLESALKQAGF